MMYAEDNIAFQFSNEEGDNFLNSLLQPNQEFQSLPLGQLQKLIKQPSNPELNEPQAEYNRQFSLTLLEREQFNYKLPERPFQQQGEEDAILIKTLSKRIEEESSHGSRKEQKIDKLAYQQQSRAAKIQRYRDKKTKRKWGRKVFYDCRKIVADKRERVNGRFVKKSPFVHPIESIHKNSLATGEIEIPKQLYESSRFFEVEQLFLP